MSTLEVHLAKYKPLKGSSYIELPDALKAKGAVINVKNTDEQCFKWAVLKATSNGIMVLFPQLRTVLCCLAPATTSLISLPVVLSPLIYIQMW